MSLKILELGVGSGAVINSFYLLIMKSITSVDTNKLEFYGTDINPKAIDCA